MTPEQLDEIQGRIRRDQDRCRELGVHIEGTTLGDFVLLLDYIDLLHEDLALTRQERDHAKHQALEHRKARAQAEKGTE